MNISLKTFFVTSMTILFLLSLSACSLNEERDVIPKKDKYEKFNRKVFRFNKKLDNAIVKPIAKGYKKITPDIVEKGISNFFANIGDIKNAFNNILQFKLVDAGNDLTRFAFNSTFGLAGFIDVASGLGMEKHNEDFGQTLAKWGVKSGSYVVTPFFGPSTLRDSYTFYIDLATNPLVYRDKSLAYSVLKGVNTRAKLLSTEKILEEVSNDEYALIRDAWLQEREYNIKDGNMDVTEQDDLASELDALDESESKGESKK